MVALVPPSRYCNSFFGNNCDYKLEGEASEVVRNGFITSWSDLSEQGMRKRRTPRRVFFSHSAWWVSFGIWSQTDHLSSLPRIRWYSLLLFCGLCLDLCRGPVDDLVPGQLSAAWSWKWQWLASLMMKRYTGIYTSVEHLQICDSDKNHLMNLTIVHGCITMTYSKKILPMLVL